MPFGRASLAIKIPDSVLLALPTADEALTQLIISALMSTNLNRTSTAATKARYSRFTYPYDCESCFMPLISFRIRLEGKEGWACPPSRPPVEHAQLCKSFQLRHDMFSEHSRSFLPSA